ncbi:MAG TPA: SpoIIE family protein phosphatase [Acidimicrobiales bacterium]|nr:SpoIIE family protein phosphatase [Acidimicrobiales bacterium]
MSSWDRTDRQVADSDLISEARANARARAVESGHKELADDVALVLSELLTNAVLHGGGCTGVTVEPLADGLRVEVCDASGVPPILGRPSTDSLTGRGLRLVARLATDWGARNDGDGKVVWAEITNRGPSAKPELAESDLLLMWDDDKWQVAEAEPVYRVELGDVPTDLLLAAKSHVDDVVREFKLASAGAQAGLTANVPVHLAAVLSAVVDRFADARLAIKRQALDAARNGGETTALVLSLPASAADAAEDYMQALDEVDSYSRARRMLTLETPPQHRVFRHWYIEELVTQLRVAATGAPLPPGRSFTRRLLVEVDGLAGAERSSHRAARLYSVASALATAATPEDVADAVLSEGVAALGASGGGLLLSTHADQLLLPGAVGYDEVVLERLRNESRDAELPTAVVLRTGMPVWLESRAERDERFPEWRGLEAATVALCAVPLEIQGRRLGALRFSFNQARLFDDDERRFVLALAAQTAQALDRAQLQRDRLDVSRRLQRSLLPPSMPEIPDLEVAVVYHPFGDGMDVGGDFYDVWPIRPGQWAIAIGDATGTGPEAVALTALVRYTLRALTISDTDPQRVMATLNTALLNANPDSYGERFCTTLFGVITAGSPIEVQLASGGHPPPMVRRASGQSETVHIGGTLLGVFSEAEVGGVRVSLEAGDTLLLVTDGVLEAHSDGPFFDTAGVEQVLDSETSSAQATATALEAAVLRHTGGSITDDMAAVVLRVPRG